MMRLFQFLVATVCSVAFLLSCGCGGSNDARPPITASSTPSGPPAPSPPPAAGGYDDSSSDDSTTVDAGASAQDPSGYGNTSPGYGSYQSPGYGGSPSPGYGGYQSGYGNTTSSNDAYAAAIPPGGGDAAANVSFSAQIEPILRDHCYECHGGGPRGKKGDLELNTPEAIQASGAVLASDPAGSDLLKRVSMPAGEEGAMPPKGPRLTPEEVELIRAWIQAGAAFDADSSAGGYGSPGYGSPGYGSPGYGAAGGGYGDSGQQNQAPPPPETLAEWASLAFRNGQDGVAMNYLYAQALSNSQDAASVLGSYRWVSTLRRPVLAVRWGVGVEYDKKGNFDAGPTPIGEEQDIPERGGRDGGSRSSSSSGYGRSGGASSGDEGGFAALQAARYSDFTDEALEYYTGLLGATLVDRLHMRIERSYYGDLLKQELEKSSATERDDLGDGQGYGGYGNQGGYGIPQQGRGGGGYGYGGGGGGGGDADEAPPDDRVAQILPGVTMLGVGARTELLQRARDEGVDALVVFGVSVERNVRARLIYNTTKMRLFNVATEDQLVASRNLNNIALQKQLEKDPEDDTINLEFDRIFEVADASFRCVDFPSQIEAKHVAARVNRLQGQKEANPLWMLGEIRFYQSRDLLSAENMAEAFAKIVPDKAADLVKGLDDDGVKSLLAPWLGTVAAAAAGTEDESDLRGADEGEQPRKKPEFR